MAHTPKVDPPTDPPVVEVQQAIIGPRHYNRFLGNPPAGMTVEEAFKAENNFDWLQEANFQQVRDKIDTLTAENNQLKSQVTVLQNQLAVSQAINQTQPHIQTSATHHGSPK